MYSNQNIQSMKIILICIIIHEMQFLKINNFWYNKFWKHSVISVDRQDFANSENIIMSSHNEIFKVWKLFKFA